MNLSNIYSNFIDSIYPRTCPVCGQIVVPKGHMICASCVKQMDYVSEPVCMKCGKHIEDETEEYCYDCKARPKSFEYGLALLNYSDDARKSMVRIKYKNKREYIEPYAKLICARYGKRILDMGADCLIPVPVHPHRLRQRGYNQAELLAGYIGEELGIEVRNDILIRSKNTVAQKKLNPDERLNNLKKAFGINESLACGLSDVKSAIIVDDIYTTGSTIEACTRVLISIGVKNVYYLSICIGEGS